MFTQLRRHPFPVRAHFRHSVVLTYAIEPELLRKYVPKGLELDEYNGVGLLAIAMVQASRLRPAGFPKFLGQDFFLAGYRVFVKYRDRTGRTLRGLRILRSYTDRRLMVAAGNVLTHYNYRLAKVSFEVNGQQLHIVTRTSNQEADLEVDVDLSAIGGLPAASPFENMNAARRYAGPLPYTFDYEAESDSIIIIEGRRSNWNPRAVHVHVGRNAFLKTCGLGTPVLANAFHVSDVDYCWLRGRREPLGGRIDGRQLAPTG